MSGQNPTRIDSESFVKLLDLLESIWTSPVTKKLCRSEEFESEYRRQGLPLWHDYYRLEVASLWQIMFESIQHLLPNGLQIALPGDDSDAESNISAVHRIFDFQRSLNSLEVERPSSLAFLVPFVCSLKCLDVILSCGVDFKTTIPELLEKASSGDSRAYLSLVRLDASFLTAPELSFYLKFAHLKEDRRLKAALSRRLDFVPSKSRRKHRRDFLALHLMNTVGFANESADTWADFLWDVGFKNLGTKDAVYKACKRYGVQKPRAKRKS